MIKFKYYLLALVLFTAFGISQAEANRGEHKNGVPDLPLLFCCSPATGHLEP